MNPIPSAIVAGALAMLCLGACSTDEPGGASPARSTSTPASTTTTAAVPPTPLCETGAKYHAYVVGLPVGDPGPAETRDRLLQSAVWLGTLSTVTTDPLSARLRVSAGVRSDLVTRVAAATTVEEVDAVLGGLTELERASYIQPAEEVEALLGRECGLAFG